MAGWKLIETAPRDGRSVLVRCGIVPDSYHVVTYVDGAWMERSGAYVLPEGGEGCQLTGAQYQLFWNALDLLCWPVLSSALQVL
jgi:hypothetical protein